MQKIMKHKIKTKFFFDKFKDIQVLGAKCVFTYFLKNEYQGHALRA